MEKWVNYKKKDEKEFMCGCKKTSIACVASYRPWEAMWRRPWAKGVKMEPNKDTQVLTQLMYLHKIYEALHGLTLGGK